MTHPFGIDISSYQASADGKLSVDFERMTSANPPPEFIAIRSGQGTGFRDQQFTYNWQKAGEKALPRIAYHVTEFGQKGVEQAEAAFGLVSAAGFDPRRDRLCVDLEVDRGYSKDVITQRTIEVVERLKELTGVHPLAYSRASWINAHLIVSMLPKIDWWLAQYKYALPWPLFTSEFPSDRITLPKGVARSQVRFHQTAEKGEGKKYGAQSHYIDCDRFLGTWEEMLKWFAVDEVEPEPPIAMDPENPLYRARVTDWATPYVNLRSETRVAKETDIGDALPGQELEVFEEREVSGSLWLRTERGWLMAQYTERLTQSIPGLLQVPFYSQNDPRWKNNKLGYGSTTLGQEGCLVTITAAGMTYFGHPETPATLNQRLIEKGGFANGNQYYWNMPAVLYGDVLKTEDVTFADGMGFENNVSRIVCEKRPVWAMVDWNPGTRAFDQHWVLIIGEIDGVFYLLDPWDGTVQALHAKYTKVFRIVGYKGS